MVAYAGCGSDKAPTPRANPADDKTIAGGPDEPGAPSLAPTAGPAGMAEVDLTSYGQPVKVFLPVGATIKKAKNTFHPAVNIAAANGFALRIGANAPEWSSMTRFRATLEKEGGEKVTSAEEGDLGWLLQHHARGRFAFTMFRKDAKRFCLTESKVETDLAPRLAACRTMKPATVPAKAKIFADEQ